MFRPAETLDQVFECFPRIRGDVPDNFLPSERPLKFSPHTRGCSVSNISDQNLDRGFPRIRGDVPSFKAHDIPFFGFSPHTRGCSCAGETASPNQQVFPAYAGMFRGGNTDHRTLRSFPRIRGDVPFTLRRLQLFSGFSPHTRGCSECFPLPQFPLHVFPAYAGMFLCAVVQGEPHTGFPRIRGDVPQVAVEYFRACWFSPHTRGCSWQGLDMSSSTQVFPAYAGMFLR